MMGLHIAMGQGPPRMWKEGQGNFRIFILQVNCNNGEKGSLLRVLISSLNIPNLFGLPRHLHLLGAVREVLATRRSD